MTQQFPGTERLVQGMVDQAVANGAVPGGGVPDFSEPRQRNVFVIDGEEFEAATALPARKAMECINIAERWETAEAGQAEELFRELFARVLLPESYERFVARLGDLERPITVQQLPKIIEWLFARFGLRPTEPSSLSATGSESPDGGTNSTDALPSQVSIPTASPSTAS